jgi:hypothetical protein
MKNYLFAILHIMGLFFGYCAFGILVSWIINIHFPFPLSLEKTVYIDIGTFVLLPIIGLICVRNGPYALINKVLGYTYLLLWLVALSCFLSFLSNK